MIVNITDKFYNNVTRYKNIDTVEYQGSHLFMRDYFNNKKYTIYLPDTEHVEILPDNEKSSDKILDELLNDIIVLNKV